MDKTMKQFAGLLGLMAILLAVQVALSGTILFNLRRSPPAGAPSVTQAGDEAAVHASKGEPIVTVPEASAVDAFVRGKANAAVTIIEFSDFQCPYCNEAYPVMKEILKNYDGKVKLAYRHFPLESHENAYVSALAAEAAGEQGKFWEMHDLLFEKAKTGTKALTRESLISHAAALKLDVKKFTEALDGERFGKKVKQDFQDGEKYGVTGTPTFFINSRKVVGAFPYDQLSRVVEEELARVSRK